MGGMNMKDRFIYQASSDQLIEKLNKYNISLNKSLLIKQYANSFNLHQLLDSLKVLYSKELQALDKQNKSITSDYLEYILDKIVRENYDVEDSIDPYYLFQELKTEGKSKEKIKQMIERLLRLNNLYHLNRVEGYFGVVEEECEPLIYRLFEDYQAFALTKEETKEFICLVERFMESYDRNEELKMNLSLLRLERIASLGEEQDIDTAIQEIKQTYGLSIFVIYTRVLLGTLDLPNNEMFEQYYQKVKQYMVLSDEDKEERAFIDNLYQNVMMDEGK